MKRARSRGFTLVELMVSLIAGLIVALAVISLAKNATNTFYNSVRLSTTEQAVRVASERLRSDLGRVGFMTTGNIKLATRDKNYASVGQWVAPTTVLGAVAELSSVNITPGGSLATYLAASTPITASNGFNPDSITIAGNFTTTDSYRGRLQGSCDGGQRVVLNVDADAAVWRLIGTATDPAQTIDRAFRPVAASSLARVVDAAGCQHYVVVTKAGVTTVPGATLAAEVCIRNGALATPAVALPQGTCGATEGSEVTINPVQRVRWYVGANTDARLEGMADEAGKNYNLYRRFLDVNGADLATAEGAPELVAEKVVDLKFGIVVDHWTNRTTVIDYYSGQDADIATWTGLPTLTDQVNTPSPHRVRSIRYRLASRAAIPDRTAILPDQVTPFQTRYCMDNVSYADCKRLSRMRVISSEVALINQARMLY